MSGEFLVPANAAPRPHVRGWRRQPLAVFLLLLGMLELGYIGFSLLAQARLPSDGVLWSELMMSGVTVATRLDPTSALRVGDNIIAIDGRTIWDWAEGAWHGDAASSWEVGQTVIYQIRRNGAVLDIPVLLQDFPIGRLPLARFGVYALAIAAFVIGCYILISRPSEMAAHLFYITALFLVALLALHVQVMTLVTPWLLGVESVLKFSARVLLFSFLLHLFLIFPVAKVSSRSGRRFLRLIHGVIPVISVTLGMLLGETSLRRFVLASQIATWLGLLLLAGSVASLVHTYFAARVPAVRGQIRWVAWGVIVGVIPYMMLTGLPEVLIGQAVLTIEVTAFFLIAVPVALAIAIARYRLFDIDVLVWRTLFYALYVIVMAGFYLLVKGFVGRVIVELTGVPDAVMSIFLATCLAVSAFWILRMPMERFADRILYRARHIPHFPAKHVVSKLTGAIHIDQLSAFLSEELPQQIGAARGALWVLSEDGIYLESPVDATFSLPVHDALQLWIERGAEPILYSDPHSGAAPAMLTLMGQQAIELAVLLRVGLRIVGLWGLGPREGRLSYTTKDVRFIKTVAQQAALAVENARLVQHMQRYQQHLEDEVQRRTRVMENDRNRLNAIVQNMADALLVTDGSEHIQLTNPAFEKLVRLSSRSLLGRRLMDILPLPELSGAIKRASMAPGTVHITTITLMSPHISVSNDVVMAETILRISVTALGDKSAVICVLRDITYEVEVDRMKSEFISTISHELRTPVTALMGFAKLTNHVFGRSIRPQLPQDSVVQDIAQRIDHNLNIMVEEGENLTTLINEILDIAALDARTMLWDNRHYGLLPLLEDVVERFREMADAKGLVIEMSVVDDVPMLFVDPLRIEQVVGNLISNAIKFTECGTIKITAQRLAEGDIVHEWGTPAGGGVLVMIEDTGAGIAPQFLSNIFRRFWQGEDMIRGKPPGAGLGLAIARDIITHYGGDMWVESTVDVGSTFYFTLPIGDGIDSIS